MGGRKDGVHDALEFVHGLALHAQGDEEDAGLDRIDDAVEDGLHTDGGLFLAYVLRQFRTGGDALDNGMHHLLRVLGDLVH